MQKLKTTMILIIICIVGFLLRYHNYTIWPREGATFDEFAWSFQGLSILQHRMPTSWSPHQAYRNKQEYYNPQGAHFVLVTPYLEHPPVFGLFVGVFELMNGIDSFDEVTIQKIRPLALMMGVFAIISVYMLGAICYGSTIGLIAAGIYSVIPTVVIGSRLVQNENFFIPMWLFGLALTYRYIKKVKKKTDLFMLIFISMICGLLVLAKIPWIASSISIIILFIYYKHWKEAMFVGLITALFFSIWMIYGFKTDPILFINLWRLQLARYDMTFNSFFTQFTNPLTVDRQLIDGWIFAGWLVMFWLLGQDIKKHSPITVGFLSYMFIYLIAIPSEPLHGWYRYPFYPFLTIAIAIFIVEYFNKAYIAIAAIFSAIWLTLMSSSWEKSLGFSYPVLRGFIGALVFGVLPVFFSKKFIRRIAHMINYMVAAFCVVLSIWTILAYNEQ